MAHDPLRVLLRVRQLTLDAARRHLADRMRSEAAAVARSAEVAMTIAQETSAQTARPELAGVPNAYAAWLARIKDVQCAANEAVRSSALATADARVSVNDERVAARALEAVSALAEETRRRNLAQEEQRMLDEAALHGGTRRWSG